MDQISPINLLEQQLKVAGEQLSSIPHSTKDLLDLLDKMEHLLTLVGQAPSPSMQVALVPSMGALIADELLSHSDADVRVSVASCLCEIARITAPEQPYKDDIMKEIFQLNVMAFGELSHMFSRSYHKAIHILESVAKVKSCLLMLDLECDALIFAMFEQFLGTIRSNHPLTVFSNMEAIMTLAIEESDEIPMDLLTLLLSHVRKQNQNLSPLPWKLAEKVLRNCSDILKPYSKVVMQLISSDPDDYADVVTSLCENALEHELVIEEGYHEDRWKGQLKNEKSTPNQETTSDLVQDPTEDRTLSRNKVSTEIGSKEKHQKGLKKTKGVIKSYAKGSRMKGYGEELVGHRIKVWWPLDKMYYEGAVFSYDPLTKKHKILYADGDEETLNLRHQMWRMLDDVSPIQKVQGVNLSSPTTISLKHQKKAKTNTESPFKQEDASILAKRDANASNTNDYEKDGTVKFLDVNECYAKSITRRELESETKPESAEIDESERRRLVEIEGKAKQDNECH